MGRYKSVLMAERDAQDFPVHVSIPVPPHGLGMRIDAIGAWLEEHVGKEWRSHGHVSEGRHLSRYMFRSTDAATAFARAIETGKL